ncbi:hypothetical protein ABK040_006563 [Willaertia magna]
MHHHHHCPTTPIDNQLAGTTDAALSGNIYAMMAMNHSMPMYFVNRIEVYNLLWENLNITEWWHYTLAIIIVFLISILNQFFIWIIRRQVKLPSIKDEKMVDLIEKDHKKKRGSKLSYLWYIVKPTVFLLQNGLSYMLMLIAMSYNVGIFLAIVVGSTVGWTLFSLRSGIVPEDCCG